MYPATRAAAIDAKTTLYFTGKPCKNGHIAPRVTANGICSICRNAAFKRWDTKNPGRGKRQYAAAKLADMPIERKPSVVFSRSKRFFPKFQEKAKGEGHQFYETGKPCAAGHISPRYTSDGSCVLCRIEHRQRNRQSRLEYERRWRAANKARIYMSSNRAKAVYRARKRQNGGTVTISDIHLLYERQKYRCAACGVKRKRLQLDHIMPVAKGGRGDPSNLQLLCGKCNRSKHAKDPFEWARSLGRLL